MIPPITISHGAKLPTAATSTAGRANIPDPIIPLIWNSEVPQKPTVRGGAILFPSMATIRALYGLCAQAIEYGASTAYLHPHVA